MLEILMSALHFCVLGVEDVIGDYLKSEIINSICFIKVRLGKVKTIALTQQRLMKRDYAITTLNNWSSLDSSKIQATSWLDNLELAFKI